MNRIQKLSFPLILLTLLLPGLGQTKVSAPHPKKERAQANTSSSGEIAQGQKIFEQNCSRCHSAPQQIPPQISGTILRHMRVRASLSAADEKAVMGFLNP